MSLDGWLWMDWGVTVVPALVGVLQIAVIRSPLYTEESPRVAARALEAACMFALSGRGLYVMLTVGDWPLSPAGGLPVLGIAVSRLLVGVQMILASPKRRRATDRLQLLDEAVR